MSPVLRQPETRFPRARRSLSTLQLILLGFLLVILPLAAALVTALVMVDRLTGQGQQAVFEAVNATRSSRMLLEDLTAMERSARQYQVLHDGVLLDAYAARRREFIDNLIGLEQVDPRDERSSLLARLREREAVQYQVIMGADASGAATAAALDEFHALMRLAQALVDEGGHAVAREVESLQLAAARGRQMLLWEAAALVPAVVALAVLFITLITRPLRQIDRAIRQLGAGHLDTPIVVSGPHDLADLGRRLDWLRGRLQEVDEQKLRFLRHISHELKTPLTNIREGVELLNERVVGGLNQRQAEIAGIVRHNSLQLQKRIEDLLRFSAVTAALPPEPVALDELIGELVAGYRVTAEAREVRFRLALTPLIVHAQRDRLATIFDNLLSNAIKFAPDGTHIGVEIRRGDGVAVIEVSDAGPGVAVTERERIFDAFYQGFAPARGRVKGSGLGLSIAREYARAMGGRIEVLEGEKGARFRVTLPL